MISIKDYARETGVTYEAVRQRIKRYEDDLEGHIHRQGRTQFLDDVAVAFLNDHRLQNPVVLYDKGYGEDYRALQDELADAKAQAKDYWEQLKQKEATMATLVQQNEAYRLQAASVARLEADNEAARARAAEAEKKASEAEIRAQEAIEAAEKETKILEGFIADAKEEIKVLTEEKAREVSEARQEAQSAVDEAQAAKAAKEAVEAENEALKAQVAKLESRKWYQLIFKKGK